MKADKIQKHKHTFHSCGLTVSSCQVNLQKTLLDTPEEITMRGKQVALTTMQIDLTHRPLGLQRLWWSLEHALTAFVLQV